MDKFENGQVDRTAFLTYRMLHYARHSEKLFTAMKDSQPEMIEGAAGTWLSELIRMTDELLDELAQLHILGKEGTKAFKGRREKQLPAKMQDYKDWVEATHDQMFQDAADELRADLGLE